MLLRTASIGPAIAVAAIVAHVAIEGISLAAGLYETPELSARAVLNLGVGVVFGVCAMVAWRLMPSTIAGWLMVAVALSWQAGSWLPMAYQAGWVWPVLTGLTNLWPLFVGALVLSYPSGTLFRDLDRMAAGAALAVAALRFGSTLLFDGPLSALCVRACTANVYAVLPYPALARQIDELWRVVGFAFVLWAAGRLLARCVATNPPAKRIAAIMPLALLVWVAVSVYDAASRASTMPFVPGLTLLTPIALSSVPIAFLGAVVHVHNLRSRVTDLVLIARDGVNRTRWQESLQHALDDPSLRVFWWDATRGGYLDSEGVPADPKVAGDRREGSLLYIDGNDHPIAVINHDIGLAEDVQLLEAVSAALRISVDNDQLRSRLEQTLADVRESRIRLVEAGDTARQRIERDLHDGSQQQLVSIAINLQMIAAEAAASGNTRLRDQITEVSDQLGDALTTLRSLARGIHPAALTDGGLETAVRELAARCPVPVDVRVEMGDPPSRLVEATVYFVVAECLTNVAKYGEASRATVTIVQRGGSLEFRVSDDGVGGADPALGTGIRGMTDRTEALGGRLEIVSEPRSGTVVVGSLPLRVDVTSQSTPVVGDAQQSRHVDAG